MVVCFIKGPCPGKNPVPAVWAPCTTVGQKGVAAPKQRKPYYKPGCLSFRLRLHCRLTPRHTTVPVKEKETQARPEVGAKLASPQNPLTLSGQSWLHRRKVDMARQYSVCILSLYHARTPCKQLPVQHSLLSDSVSASTPRFADQVRATAGDALTYWLATTASRFPAHTQGCGCLCLRNSQTVQVCLDVEAQGQVVALFHSQTFQTGYVRCVKLLTGVVSCAKVPCAGAPGFGAAAHASQAAGFVFPERALPACKGGALPPTAWC